MTRHTRRYATATVVLLLITATFVPVVTVSALPSIPSESLQVQGDTASVVGNDETTTVTETTTTATTTTETTTATTTTATATATTTSTSSSDGLAGVGDPPPTNGSKPNANVSSRVSSIVDDAGSNTADSDLVTQSQDGTTFVTVVLEAEKGRGDEAVATARRNGGTVQQRYENLVRAELPAPAVETVANSSAVEFVRTPRKPDVTGTVSTGGLNDMNVGGVHDKGFTGEGTTIAVIDLGFNTSNPEISDNVVKTMDTYDGDFQNEADAHGTAVSELIVDTAPNVSLVLIDVSYEMGIMEAAEYVDNHPSIDAVSMSLGFRNGPFDGTSTLDQRIATSVDRGTPWFVSSGNAGGGKHLNTSWNNPDGDSWLNFKGQDETINVTPPCSSCQVSVSVSWDDYQNSDQDYDVYLLDGNNEIIDKSETSQTGDQRPEERVSGWASTSEVQVAISNYNANGNAEFQIFSNDGTSLEYYTNTESIMRPATEEKSVAVGAMYYGDNQLEPFSSRGPTIDGRRGVDIVAPDGVETTVYDSFYGTSAAAPYTAGVAALVVEASNEPLTATEIENALTSTTTTLQSGEPNPRTGYGLVDAKAAVESVTEPEASATSSSLDYGEVNTGSTVSKTVTLTNDGTASLEISDVSVSGTNAGAFTVASGGSSGVLQPGESRQVQVEFAPSSYGGKSATLTISHNDTDASPTEVALSGTGLAPVASVTPTSVDYGDVGVLHGNESRDVTITNDGNVPLNLTTLQLSGDNATEYHVTSGNATPSLAPGETHVVTVSFDPDSKGSKTATLSVEHNDSDVSPTTVTLAGQGADLTGPDLGDATVGDQTDGNGVVADGDAVIVAVNATDALGNVNSVTVDASAFGAGTVTLSDGDGDGRYNATFTVNESQSAKDGSQQFDVTATDGVGNGNTTVAGSLTLDTTAPALTITEPDDASATNATRLDLEGSVSDAASSVETVEFNATGQWKDANVFGNETWQGRTSTVGSEGTYVVEVRAVDVAGNVGPAKNVTVFVDWTEPNLSNATLGRTSGIRPEEELAVVANASDDFSGIGTVVTGDGALSAVAGDRWNGTVEAEPSLGNHSVTVEVRDAAGNTVEKTLSYEVGIRANFTAENRTLVAHPDGSAIENVTINATETANNETLVVGAATTNPTDVLTPNDTALSFPQINTTVANANISNGSFTVTVRRSHVESEFALVDTVTFWVHESGSWNETNGTLVAENETHLTYEVGAPHFSTFAITAESDSTKPTVSSLGPTDSAVVDSNNVTVTASYADDYAGIDAANVTLYVDGNETTSEATINASGITYDATLSDGTHDVRLLVADRAGNLRTRTWSFTVDTSNGGGGGGGGSGGGGGDPPEPLVQVKLAEVTPSSVTATVASARAGAPGRIAPEGGISAGDLTVQRVSVYPKSKEALAKFTMDVAVATETSGNGMDGKTLGYVEMGTSNIDPSRLDTVVVRFAVPKQAATAPENVVLYRRTADGWTAVETEVVGERDGEYVLKATTGEVGTFAVGVESSELSVTEATVDTSQVEAGATVEVTATVENRGDGTGATTVELTVDGTVVEEQKVTVPAGESKTVTFEVSLDESGQHEVAVGGVSAGSVSVGGSTTEKPVSDDSDSKVKTTGIGSEENGNGGGIPGFGFGITLLALLAGLLVVRSRR